MGKNFQQQIKVVSRDDIRPSTTLMEAAFFDADGNPISVGFTPASNVTAVSHADGSDLATTQALANAIKLKFNETLAALKAAGLMVAD